jgi:hypothetical protein
MEHMSDSWFRESLGVACRFLSNAGSNKKPALAARVLDVGLGVALPSRRPAAAEWSYFQAKWKPKAWKTAHRFLFIRTRVKQQHKDPIQLDLFVLHDYGYEFKVILTNQPLGARKTLVFHNGRGSQEGIFA